ncbi:hypothetical protein W97_09165 [Coniosporium apollinis CBS 100218]|uniref:Ubiquitin 3 binding protein But2 C-terminal domain-containing protein n=1 Tax=Coniosporium apollinis (strain CBS 100218) TaxID=1168221 RepID=R7Z7H7_CONA1|nr:uncharacterized protein W97_09165 [Coniosporium apollinis CBS 100218]EON69901.1 hypothetical protein W97_09165 [Coniosporium apollinis CBS 100218]
MKFTSSAIAAVLGFTFSVFAAPTGYQRSSTCTTISSTSSTCTPTTPTTPTCTPTPPPCPDCPAAISLYEVWTGAVQYKVDEGKIFKSGKTTDITTLATFEIPAWTGGLTCEFVFELTEGATLTGSKRFQVFTSQKPATASSKSWPSGNLRDQNLGTMEAVKPGRATIVEGPATSAFFPCPAGQTIAGELVGQNDQVDIAWNNKVAGPRIRVHH